MISNILKTQLFVYPRHVRLYTKIIYNYTIDAIFMQNHNKKELPRGDSPMYIVHLTYDKKAFIFIHFYERVNFTIFCYCYRSPPVLHGPGSKKKVQLVGAAGCLSGAAKIVRFAHFQAYAHALRRLKSKSAIMYGTFLIETVSFHQTSKIVTYLS